MTATLTRLYNSHVEAREVVRNLEAAGVRHGDISILASNADNWYTSDGKTGAYPDRDLDGKDDRVEARRPVASSGLLLKRASAKTRPTFMLRVYDVVAPSSA
jgi:hypothetical protein